MKPVFITLFLGFLVTFFLVPVTKPKMICVSMPQGMAGGCYPHRLTLFQLIIKDLKK